MKNLSLILLFCLSCALGQGRTLIEGEAEYNFSDRETLIEAKSLCYNMALRNAVESYQIFVSSMSDVRNMQLRNDIIQTLSTGYLEDLTVVDERIDKNNNIIYYKLKAYIQPESFKKALKQEVARKVNFSRSAAITENDKIRILKISKESRTRIEFIYQTKKEMGTSRQVINITYYGSDGIPVGGETKTIGYRLGANEVRNDYFYNRKGDYFEIWFPGENKVEKKLYDNLQNWRKLRNGMTPSQVRSILGEPIQISGGAFTTWNYTKNIYSTVRVRFYNNRVESWVEPK
ncbi:MAG: outer membrane protein assembly factor BamE [Candidatus Marinimicrobia bacterium]|jgi:hypothetical protein|nr:outer membrane protein assembly factor BamE [Candidatus Neomarinimicrobiota bacterium]MBT6938280.1 outer membrane protein assembly factor BamE [Candidatus Neomarinimicrobiota bacterium]MBT6939717.1 outer membrane protein assembly factor BamE [Candidatus Neomarinimicrobiota bacterium]